MDRLDKFDLLGDAAQFDVSAPGVSLSEALRQAEEDLRRKAAAIFHAQVGGGRCVPVLKVLMSNECRNDCYYCATRCSANVPRATYQPEELVSTFLDLEHKGLVKGLFLSSGIRDSAERTQEQMLKVVELLRRKHEYRGYIHLKVLPGVSDAAIEAAARLGTRLSVNLEAATVQRLAAIAPDKAFREELLRPLQLASRLHQEGLVRSGITTQFVVGAPGDTDREFLRATDWLYRRLGLHRAYFSAFRPVAGSPLQDAPPAAPRREQRLYQADWLLRVYGVPLEELVFDEAGGLSLSEDPKLVMARARPDQFPVEVNTAPREALLRVPGLGPRSVQRILAARAQRSITGPRALALLGVRPTKARDFLTFNGHFMPSAPHSQTAFAL